MNNQAPSFDQYQTAPLWRRLTAMVYDSFLVLAVSMAYGALTLFLFTLVSGTENKDYAPVLNGPLFQLGWLAAIGGFYIYFWRAAGQTAGMKAWRLIVTDREGNAPRVKQCLLRFVISIFSFLLFGMGYWISFFRKDRQTLHDWLSHTQTSVTPKPQKNK